MDGQAGWAGRRETVNLRLVASAERFRGTCGPLGIQEPSSSTTGERGGGVSAQTSNGQEPQIETQVFKSRGNITRLFTPVFYPTSTGPC